MYISRRHRHDITEVKYKKHQ